MAQNTQAAYGRDLKRFFEWNQRSSRTKYAAAVHTWHEIMLGLQFNLGHLDHFGLQPVDLIPRWRVVDDFNFGQNVPPPMPFKAVK